LENSPIQPAHIGEIGLVLSQHDVIRGAQFDVAAKQVRYLLEWLAVAERLSDGVEIQPETFAERFECCAGFIAQVLV
jgi:hypothetical protein